MIRIAVAQDQNTPPSVRFYRTSGPVSFLERQFQQSFRVDYLKGEALLSNEMHVFPYDVVLIERAISETALSLIHLCKSQGIVSWVDYDDNLLQIPDYNHAQDYFSIPHHIQLIQQIMQSADLITVSTPHLKNLYSGFNRNVHLIRNAWCDFKFPMPSNSRDEMSKSIRMAWRGGNKHDGDVYEVKAPLMQAIADPAFNWTFYGWRPFFLNILRDNYRPFSGLFSYFKNFFLGRHDFLFVPLSVNDFNKSKSNCSWIEATLAGAVTIAPIGLPEFDQPGVIRYKDNAHLKMIFADIKKGKYDKHERVEASREALAANFRLSEFNKIRKGLLESFYMAPVEQNKQAVDE